MNAFRFRLQQVLQLRLAERDTRRSELAQAQQAADVLDEQAATLRGEIEDVRASTVAACQPGTLNVDRILNSHRFERMLKVQLGEIHRRRTQIDAEIQRRRQRLVEADQLVRALEQLREKQAAEHTRMVDRGLQKEFDEMAGRRFREQHAAE